MADAGRQMTMAALDRRRGIARIRAIIACLVGVVIFGMSAAALVMIVLAAAARFWSWLSGSGFAESPVWSWAPGGAGALAAFAVVVSVAGTFWYFWWGASPQVLREVAARPIDDSTPNIVANVVEELSIGVGRRPPTIYVTDDPVPNALSLRSRRRRALVVTTACAELPRDELEAMCAHEFGHLWADDAHWVTSGMVALARARRFGSAIQVVGVFLIAVVIGIAYYADIYLWSAGVTALALIVLGFVSTHSLRTLECRIRGDGDEIADVAAIQLARHPQSLGAVCARLAANPAVVAPVGWRSELMWFEATVGADELVERAVRAYATARVPLPPDVATLAAGS